MRRAEEMAHVEALRWKDLEHIPRAERRPVELKYGEVEGEWHRCQGGRNQVMQGLINHRKELECYTKKIQVLKHKSIMVLLMFSKYYSGCCAEKKVKVKRPR